MHAAIHQSANNSMDHYKSRLCIASYSIISYHANIDDIFVIMTSTKTGVSTQMRMHHDTNTEDSLVIPRMRTLNVMRRIGMYQMLPKTIIMSIYLGISLSIIDITI